MAYTNGDAKKEIAEIISGIGSDERPVSSTKEAFKIVAIYPILMLFTVILMWFVFYAIMVLTGDNSGQKISFYFEAAQLIMGYGGWVSIGVTTVVAIFFILINYSTALLYLSIPEDIRRRSKILATMKSTVKKTSLMLWVGATLLSFVGVWSDWMILLAGSIPAVLFISIFIINGYLGIQSARYGLGSLMSTANKMLSR
ncbi:TPA: hypothetical protein QCJ61_003788 [Enterobacter asburiae]|nr:hypothetical protein [Enterobacter asburiae]HDR2805756.1 hypothetical protein [Enterobacter asburiae]HDR2811326.1 hypothetical protein [Enterobacter asburiae]HDR2816763.1 hypothetical protein [Enterobacter asburiae]